MVIVTFPLAIPNIDPPTRYGVFHRRRNRFVVELTLLPPGTLPAAADRPVDGVAEASGTITTTASLPNPGRMQELLLPGTVLGLAPGPPAGKHPWRVRSLHQSDRTVPLDTGAANRIVGHLLEQGLVPGLRGHRVVRAEVPGPGDSRFDFLVTDGGRQYYLEVKSCTLFAGDWALFPDAVTDRGRRHVEELAETPGGTVLFLVHSDRVRAFAPDVHSDLAFARTLHAQRRRVRVLPLALRWDSRLRLAAAPRPLPLPWERVSGVLEDRGSYVVLLRAPMTRRITVGALGERSFPAGYYLYVGSAMQHLTKRLARHRRGGTRRHWHIDYLRAGVDWVDSYAIRDPRRREEEVARRVAAIAEDRVPGFGASDSNHDSHLFYWSEDPRQTRAFQDLVLTLRAEALGPASSASRGDDFPTDA